MHFGELLDEVFADASSGVDKRVHRTLLQAAQALCECRRLSIAGLGRHLHSRTAVKHVIKRVDRLFGHRVLHAKREEYYRLMAQRLVGEQPHPVVLVDWSGLSRCGEYHFLRASVPVGGRSLVVWEGSYREREYASAKAHRACVQALKRILPKGCRPVVVSDAGFRNPWFKLIARQDWEFLGRVRHQTQCCRVDGDEWVAVKSVYGQAKHCARHLFEGWLAKSNRVRGHFYVYRERAKKRSKTNLRGRKVQSSVSVKHARRAREPWLLFSSLSPEHYAARDIVALYRTRMQTEEAFRDLKNPRNGFSLRQCRSHSTQRLDIALLIAALATFALWLMGLVAKIQQVDRLFQANTVRKRPVLSTFSIGWQSLRRKLDFRRHQLQDAMSLMHSHAVSVSPA